MNHYWRTNKHYLRILLLTIPLSTFVIIDFFLAFQIPSFIRQKSQVLENEIITSIHLEDNNEPFSFTREPMVEEGCILQFVDKDMVFCHQDSSSSFDRKFAKLISQRLLEYVYHCSSKSLVTINDINDIRMKPKRKCVWIGSKDEKIGASSDVIWDLSNSMHHPTYIMSLLVNDLFQDYYWLPTSSVAKKPYLFKASFCLIDNTEKPENNTIFYWKQKFIKIVRITTNQEAFSFLADFRLCDWVVSNSLNPLILADSLGIPNIAARQEIEDEYTNYLSLTNRTLLSWDDRFKTEVISKHIRASITKTIMKHLPHHLFSRSKLPVIDKPKLNKTLVIIMGNIRGGEVTWRTFYNHMLDLNSADLALVIGKTSEKQQISSLFRRAKYLYEFPEFPDWGDEIDGMYNDSGWKQYILPYANEKWGTFGGIANKRGSGAVIFMIRQFVAKFLQEYGLLEKYDRFVLSRSDHYYSCDHDLSLLDNKYMWVPRGEDYKNGITDRHLICNKDQILKALHIYPPIFKYPEKYASQKFATLNPEQLIRLRWEQENLWQWVRRFDRVMFTCAVEGDETRWTEKSNSKVKEGVFLKYTYEYEEATCICKTGTCDFPYTKRKMRLGYPQHGKNLM